MINNKFGGTYLMYIKITHIYNIGQLKHMRRKATDK